jgi:hypothetical protein
MPKKKNTVAKIGKDVVTFSDSSEERRLSLSEPSVNAGHGPSARGPPPASALDDLEDRHNKPKKYLRKSAVAARYSCDLRTIDRMAEDGWIPPPDVYNGRIPLWGEDRLDENDRRAVLLPRPTQAA